MKIDLNNLQKEEEIQFLDIFEGEIYNKSWCFQDIYLVDYDKQKVIWERKSEDGIYMDVFI